MPVRTNDSKKGGGLKIIVFFLCVSLLIVITIGTILYFMNQNPEIMPDAKPANPVENGGKPPAP